MLSSARFQERLARRTLALVLAGGRGSRLKQLTDRRAKPAVFFGGKFRIIDFALSNCLNSNIRRIAVLPQYKAHSLLRHLQMGWSFLRPEMIEKLVHLGAQKRPAHLQMPQQAVRFVLGEDSDATDVRIEAIRQRKIDDAEFAAEKYGGLGAAVRQLFEPAAAATRQHQRERTPRQPFLEPRRGQHGGVPPTPRLTQSGRRGEPIRK